MEVATWHFPVLHDVCNRNAILRVFYFHSGNRSGSGTVLRSNNNFTFTQETDLVVEQYYEATITYQDHIDRSERALNLDEPLRVEQTGDYVDIIFPASMRGDGLTGTVHLYRPSGSSMDVKLPVDPDDEGVQRITLEGKAKGLWTVKIDWDHYQTGYFAESRLYLQ